MATMNTADIGFEREIWKAADKMRGNIDASEYKSVVLGLIFLKYISDKFETKYRQLVAFGLGFGMMSPSYQTLFINLAEPTRRGTANATYLIAWDVGIGAAVLLGGLIAEISSFDDAFILGLIMLFFSAVLYMKVIGPQYEKNKLR